MKKTLLRIMIFSMVFVFLASFASAQLAVYDVKGYVDGDKQSNVDEDGGSFKDVVPESVIRLVFKLENEYSRNSDIDIKDVLIEGTIIGIDDGDDIEEESEENDIDADDRETFELEFEIPLEVEEDDYELFIEITGENESGSDFYINLTYEIQVEKDKHNVIIKKADLLRSTLECDRTSNLEVKVVNIGREDEDESKLKVTNSDLGIDFQKIFDLDSDPFDDDSTASFDIPILVSDKVKPGSYPIMVEVLFDDEDDSNAETVNLVVKACDLGLDDEDEDAVDTVDTPVIDETDDTKEDVIVEIKPVQETKPVAAVVVEESFLQKHMYTIIVALLYILVIAVGIVLVTKLVKKK